IKSSQSNRSSSSLSDGADDSSDSDVPLAKKRAPAKPTLKTNGTSRTKTAPKYKEESSDSDSDIPLAKKAPKKPSNPSKDVKVKREPESKSTVKKRVKDEPDTNGKVKKVKKEEPEPTKPSSKKIKKESETNGKLKKAKKEESEDEDENAWWKNQNENEDDTVKWNTLIHNGVYFPPDYVPHGIKMKYDGKPIKLAPEVEEVASFFAALL
ncbi:DNA topoisomerase 1, partial [Haplosporangium bisporale]